MAQATAALIVWSMLAATEASAQNQPVDYARDVQPILAANCFGCHGPRQQQSGLRLDLRQNALRGGDYGVVIVPGNAADSKLIKRLIGPEAGVQMPPTGSLPQHEIDVLRAWIDAGADMPGRAAGSAPAARETSAAMQRLIDAIGSRDIAAVKALLGADTALARASDGAGSTALMHAASRGTVAIMQTLVDAGADVNAKNAR